MTDPLDTDLTALLARRAAAVGADIADGETAIATRLEAGDQGMADILAVRTPTPRSLWVAVAAAIVVVALAGVALDAARDDERLVTQQPVGTPVIFTGTGTAADVALAYLVDRLEVSPDMLAAGAVPPSDVPPGPETAPDQTLVAWSFSQLGFAEHPALSFPIRGFVTLQDLPGDSWTVVEAYSDAASIDEVSRTASSITARSTGPAGTSLRLTVHRLDGAVISDGSCEGSAIGQPEPELDAGPVDCEIVDARIPYADEAVTVRLSVVTVDGARLTLEERLEPPATTPDASVSPSVPSDATSVPEQSFGESATVGTEFESAKDVAERVAQAVFSESFFTIDAVDDDAVTLVTMEGPGGNAVAEVIYDEGAGGERVLRISPAADLDALWTITDGSLSFELPEPGDLTYAILDGDLNELFATTMPGLEGGVVGALGPLGEDPRWISVRLDTPDGRVLVWFSSLGD